MKSRGLSYHSIATVAGVSFQRVQQLLGPPPRQRWKRVIDAGQICSKCKKPAAGLHFHHPDYSKPDEYEIICARCHSEEHNGRFQRPSVHTPDLIAGLVDREIQVLELLCKGFTNKEVAGALSLSSKTVEKHRQNAYYKLNADNLAKAVIALRRFGVDLFYDVPLGEAA